MGLLGLCGALSYRAGRGLGIACKVSWLPLLVHLLVWLVGSEKDVQMVLRSMLFRMVYQGFT